MANTKITSRVLADNAVLTANITDANVTTAKIAADAITGAKIADDVALGGNPTTSTQSAGNNTTRVATTAFVSTAVSNLVDSSPSALNTLNELAAALGDDANFSTTVTNSIAAKLPLAGGTMTGALDLDGQELKLDADADTSITADTDDVVDFKVGGTDRLRLAGNNLFLNGATDARIQLGSGGAGANTVGNNTVHIRGDGVDAKYMAASGGDHIFESNGGHLVTMKDSGKVGIGNASPSHMLHVNAADGASDNTQAMTIENNEATDGRSYGLKIKAGSTANDASLFVQDHDASNDHFIIRGNGKVGIGTTSPDTLLNLKDTGGIELRLEADSNNNGQEDCFIRFYTDGKTQEGIAGMDNNNSSTLFSGNTENAMVFGTVSNLPVVLATNNTERLQISAAGNVGINNTSPAQKLHVGGGVRFSTTPADGNETRFNFGIGGAADDPTLVIYRHDGSSESVRFQPGSHIYFENKLLVGTTSTTGMSGNGIESNGSIRANNYILSTDLVGTGHRNLNARSDGIITTGTSLRELKENITDMSLGLSDVLKLKPREFDWKKTPEGENSPSIEGDTEDIGFIADEVFDVSPKLATYKVGDKAKDNLQGVKYDTMTSLLVKAIQEQQTIIEDLKARIETLEG